MAEIQLGVIEARYADMIWEHEPVSSSELVKLTEEAFHWKRTTAHNVLRRLCDKGLFRNDNGTVTSLISREEFYAMQSRQFVEDTFEGSLPAFLAAFTKDRALTAEEAAKIRKMSTKRKGEQEAIAAAKEQLNATQQTEQNSNQAWIYLENSSYSGFFAAKGYAANGKAGTCPFQYGSL